jgi:hypothetical protein
MITAHIQAWIAENGAFATGLQLLQQVDEVAFFRLKKYLQAGIITPAMKQELRQALEKTLKSAASTQQNTATEPAEIARLRQQARGYLKQQAELKARLRLMYDDDKLYTDEDRFAIAEELVEQVTPALDAIYSRIREWQATGTLPVQSMQEVVTETVAKYKQILSLTPRISRLQKWLKDGERPTSKGIEKITPAIKLEIETELQEKLQQLQSLQQELGLDA